MTVAAPRRAEDASADLTVHQSGPLEELHGWCRQQQVEAAHGRTLEDAGRSSAYARVMKRIRELQSNQ